LSSFSRNEKPGGADWTNSCTSASFTIETFALDCPSRQSE
jgi:hypothetical protein